MNSPSSNISFLVENFVLKIPHFSSGSGSDGASLVSRDPSAQAVAVLLDSTSATAFSDSTLTRLRLIDRLNGAAGSRYSDEAGLDVLKLLFSQDRTYLPAIFVTRDE